MNATSEPEIAPLFPTPLLRIDIPPELSTACNLFENTEMLHEKESRMEYGIHSKNTYIMDEPECVDLKKFVFSNNLVPFHLHLFYPQTSLCQYI